MPADLKSKIAGIIRNCVMATVRTEIDGSLQGIEEAASRIAALVPAAEWQPIETAPRDGTHFQTWDSHYGVRIGRAVNRADHDDWLSYVGSHGESAKGGMRATHWQSLPTPPGTPVRRVYTGEDVQRILQAIGHATNLEILKGTLVQHEAAAIARRASEEE